MFAGNISLHYQLIWIHYLKQFILQF